MSSRAVRWLEPYNKSPSQRAHSRSSQGSRLESPECAREEPPNQVEVPPSWAKELLQQQKQYPCYGGRLDMAPRETSFTSTFNGSSSPTYDVGGYYSCNAKDDNVKFNTDAMNYTVQPVFEDVKLEPFVKKNASDAFGKEKFPCYQDNPTKAPASPTTGSSGNNDIVPIAVGCALAGLVLIVLIAYIIGRRKSHRGYEKV